jgi:nitroreductase
LTTAFAALRRPAIGAVRREGECEVTAKAALSGSESGVSEPESRVRGAAERDIVQALLGQRYGEAGPNGATELLAEPAATQAVLANLFKHRSVRRYLPEPLPRGTLELLVGAAQSAASSSNLQLWSVVAVDDPEKRRALSEVAGNQAHILQCPLFLVWVADLHRPTELAARRGITSAGLDYLEMFLMASIDTALAAQNAVVAAEALGLGTVYIGALRNAPERVSQILELPQKSFAVFGLCVGWPDPAAAGAIKPRLPQAVVVHRDGYAPEHLQHAAVDGYDQLMQRFYTEQRMAVPEGGWSIHSAKRVANIAALRGRDVLRQALARLGFELR